MASSARVRDSFMREENSSGSDNRDPVGKRLAEMRSRGRPPHPNLLSKGQMEALTAFCDSLLPSLDAPPPDHDHDHDHGSYTDHDAVTAFYRTSASMLGTAVDQVGELISGGFAHPLIFSIRLALWLLSTWYGTFAMCGMASLSDQFPYFQKLCKVGPAQREGILSSWSQSPFFLYRMLFKCIKCLTMLVAFALVNEKNDNPYWKAIGYCGPDPDFVDQIQHSISQPEQRSDHRDSGDYLGPLHSALLDMDRPREVIFAQLHSSGFPTPTSNPLMTLRCDVVVVGSGSGGSVIAGVLASAGYKVLVLEKGNYFARSNLTLLEGPTSHEMYEGRGVISSNDANILFLAGATVGGGSTINWAASFRTPDHVRNEWCEEHELKRLFGSKAYDHALDVVCDRMGVQSKVLEEGLSSAVLRRGCEELGYPVSSVPCNAPSDHYCGWCHLGCKDGKKQSTQETWLADLAQSGNGLILPGCNAIKVVYGRKKTKGMGIINRRMRAYGVMAESVRSKEKFLIESKVTVVAGGALNTPGLLRRSGLKNKNIGRNLHIHPTAMAWGYFPERAEPGGWPEEWKRSYEGGILTAMSTLLAGNSEKGYGAILQTPALHPGMFGAVTPWVSAGDFRERMRRFSRTVHVFALARDKGKGTVDYPRRLGYGLAKEDEENLRRGVEAAVRVLVAAGAEEVGTQHTGGERVKVNNNGDGDGDDDCRWKDELERMLGGLRRRGMSDMRTPINSAHQMGSCRMGAREEEGAVDMHGETWEVEGLYVGDTSVFPTAVGVNPMVTVQAISYCTAHSILKVLRNKLAKQ